MSNRFVSTSSPMTGAKRILIGVTLVAVGYLAALLVSGSAAIPGGRGDNASDASAAASSVFAHRASREEGDRIKPAARDFDYFPDHYVNQAREVAEQPPTF